MIQIKSFFSDWHEVSAKQAKQFIIGLASGMTAIKEQDKARYIQGKYLKGITVEELFNNHDEQIALTPELFSSIQSNDKITVDGNKFTVCKKNKQ